MARGLPDYTEFVAPTIHFPSTEAGRPKTYETTVASAGTPNTHDVNTDLGRNGGDGYIVNDGPGDLYVYVSNDGINFMGGAAEGSTEKATLKENDIISLEGLDIDAIKIDAASDGAAYRIFVV